MTREITHMKAFMTALAAMDKDPLSIGLIKPTPKMVDQYFNASTGEGDMGEKDLLGPWNDDELIERIDAPAFQSFADINLGTRNSEAVELPDLSAPSDEAPKPVQVEHEGAPARQKSGRRAKGV